uniref:Uncharacterized protein n=1 Tax=Anguilla anguilla TaxID=7936 RepID=A0A0E9PV91_ANGAN
MSPNLSLHKLVYHNNLFPSLKIDFHLPLSHSLAL